MKQWIKEQIESMLALLGIMLGLGALEWFTFWWFGID